MPTVKILKKNIYINNVGLADTAIFVNILVFDQDMKIAILLKKSDGEYCQTTFICISPLL